MLATRISSDNEQAIRHAGRFSPAAAGWRRQQAGALSGLSGQLEGLQRGLAEAASLMTTAKKERLLPLWEVAAGLRRAEWV